MSNIFLNTFPVHKVVSINKCSCGNLHCKAIGKHPTVKGWQNWKDGDNTVIKDPNWAYRTGNGLIVIDVDPRNGGFESFKKLKAELHDLPVTVCVDTPSGGFHLYYESSVDLGCRNNWRKGIDIKCTGGYVLAPGSNHLDGIYAWRDECGPVEIDIERLPEDLENLLIKDLSPQEEPTITVTGLDQISPNKWAEVKSCLNKIKADDYETWIAAGQALHSIAGMGLEPFQAWDNWSKTSEKYSEGETNKKWASFRTGKGRGYATIFKLGKDQGVDLSDLGNFEENAEVIKLFEVKEKKVKETVKEFNILPEGVAGEASQALADAYHVIPRNIATAIASQFLPASLLQDKVKTPTMSNLGMYMLMIGMSGTGKSVVKKLVHNILKQSDITVHPKPASHTAFGKTLSQKPSGVILQEELVSWMNALTNQPAKEQLKAMILDYWQAGSIEAGQSAAMGEFAHGGYEDVKLSLIGGGVPTSWAELMQNKNFFEAGFNTRIEAYSFGKPIALTMDNSNPYDARIKEEILPFVEQLKNTKAYLDQFDEPFIIKWGEGARELYIDFHNSYVNSAGEALDADDDKRIDNVQLRSRIAEIAVRVASRVTMANFTAPSNFKELKKAVLTKEVMKWAIDYTEFRFAQYFQTVEEGSKGDEQKFQEVLIKFLERSPNKIRTMVHISKNNTCRKYVPKSADRRMVLKDMIESGVIKEVKSGRRTAYQLI